MSTLQYTWRYRISRAVLTAVFNVLVWVVVPSVILGLMRGLPSSSEVFSPAFIYAFGITITALQVLGTLAMGMAVSVPFISGSYVAEAYYIWSAVDGGVLSFTAAGLAVGLFFQPLLFLLMLPSLFGAVKAPVNYLLELSEAVGPSPDSV